jgi:UDP-glucuronate decarboxylase
MCYVDDMIEALVRLMDAPEEITGPMNLGDPNEHTVLEIARRIVELTGSKSELVFRPLPEDDPRQRQPDIGQAERALRWSPATPLDAGLSRTIDYFRNLVSGRDAAAGVGG